MDPSTVPPPAPSTWRRKVRRRSLGGAGAPPPEVPSVARRAEELEEAVWRLRAEKDAAERAAAALLAELDAERGAAETAACETMLMIARLQREKAAAMMEARELRGLAEGRAARDLDLQDRLADVSDLAASYASLLRAHGVDPEDARNYDEDEDDHSVEYLEAEVETDGESHGGDTEAAGAVAETPAPAPAHTADEESEYTVDVQCVPCAVTSRAVSPLALGEESLVDPGLYGRVAALEAESVAMRKEVAALRAERAQVVFERAMARRLCQQAAADETRAVVVVDKKPRFSVLAICRWIFSTLIVWGKTRSACAQVHLIINIDCPPPHCLTSRPQSTIEWSWALGTIGENSVPATVASTNVVHLPWALLRPPSLFGFVK